MDEMYNRSLEAMHTVIRDQEQARIQYPTRKTWPAFYRSRKRARLEYYFLFCEVAFFQRMGEMIHGDYIEMDYEDWTQTAVDKFSPSAFVRSFGDN